MVRQRGCRPPRSEAAADLQQLRWPPPSLWLSPTLPPHARNERISGVMCTVAHVASTCDATSARARQSRAGPDEPSSSVVGELVGLFSSRPETVAGEKGAGADGPARYTRGVGRARNRAADLCAHEHRSRRQLTWQAVCTRAARSRTRAGSEVCEAVSMPVGAVSATAGCRSRSSAGRARKALGLGLLHTTLFGRCMLVPGGDTCCQGYRLPRAVSDSLSRRSKFGASCKLKPRKKYCVDAS